MVSEKSLRDLVILVRGAGEMASGVAHRLHRAHFKICLLEIAKPLAVRRNISFCEAVYDGEKEVEGVYARLISQAEEVPSVWKNGKIPLLIDPAGGRTRAAIKPDVLIDAVMAKKNLGTGIADACLVIGLGPGFVAGKDVHIVIETNRGPNLGRVILNGAAEPDTKIPGEIGGYTVERVLRSGKDGEFHARSAIGERVNKGATIALVEGSPIEAKIDGVVRGLLRDGTKVEKGMKVGDIDPRGKIELCSSISEKARAIGGGVLEAILYRFNG